jgi:hypothetical protein
VLTGGSFRAVETAIASHLLHLENHRLVTNCDMTGLWRIGSIFQFRYEPEAKPV